MISFLTHPVTTFFGGAILALIGVGILLNAKMESNQTGQFVKDYREAMAKAGENGPIAGSSKEAAAIKRFTDFLKNVGDKTYIEEQTVNAYAADAYLDDVTGSGFYRAEISQPEEQAALMGDREILPGMAVDAFIRTADRTPLTYLLEPFTAYLRRAFRES